MESHSLVRALTRRGLTCWIFSGDRKSNVRSVAGLIGVQEERAFGDQTPEVKQAAVSKISNTLMMGDGFNDSTALASADLGVVVGGGLEKALHVGDVFLGPKGFRHFLSLWDEARVVEKSLGRVKLFSILYNVGSGTLAILGYANPLVAAILMPIASLSLIVIVKANMQSPGVKWIS
jgi:Cu2+-exporting ATPase/Cu+-exporting ATPase